MDKRQDYRTVGPMASGNQLKKTQSTFSRDKIVNRAVALLNLGFALFICVLLSKIFKIQLGSNNLLRQNAIKHNQV